MYFSQQESGQSTLCEHLIGLTAGEEEEERQEGVCMCVLGWWGGPMERTQRLRGKKSVSHQDLNFALSDVDKFISVRWT